MKNFIFFTVFSLLSSSLFAQASKKLNQTFTLESAKTVQIDVPTSNVKIEKIQGSRIVVEISARISSPNLTLLEFVANQGRYDLTKKIDANTEELVLLEKKSRNPLIIKGEEVIEEITYTIYVPSSVSYVGIVNSKLTLAHK